MVCDVAWWITVSARRNPAIRKRAAKIQDGNVGKMMNRLSILRMIRMLTRRGMIWARVKNG